MCLQCNSLKAGRASRRCCTKRVQGLRNEEPMAGPLATGAADPEDPRTA